jgi:small-conductance mechanosensitive channel
MKSGFTEFRVLVMNDPMEVILPVGIFLVTFLAGWLARGLVLRALSSWNRRTNSRSGQVLYQALRGPAMIWALILAAHIAFQASDMPTRLTSLGSNALLALWIVSLTVMCMRVVGDLVRNYGAQVAGAMPVTTLTQNLAQIGVVILGALILLNHFNVSITPILTALGVGGLAVALALQDTLSNLFGGFYVAVAGQVRVGDYIKLNTGEEGNVVDIGWRCTTMKTQSNNMVIVPNSKLAQAIVTNFYLPERRLATSFVVTVDYESDPEVVEKVLMEVLAGSVKEIPGMLAEPAPGVAFDPGFGEQGMAFTVSFQVAEFANQGPVRNELRKRVLRRFREAGIGIPYPTRTVYLRGSRKDSSKPAGEPAHQ